MYSEKEKETATVVVGISGSQKISALGRVSCCKQ